MGDRRKRQTYTASPAEPGGLPVMLGMEESNVEANDQVSAGWLRTDAAGQSRQCGYLI
jgi:hypothetical protein